MQRHAPFTSHPPSLPRLPTPDHEALSSSVEVHDRYHLELKLQCRSQHALLSGDTHTRYNVRAYLFFPDSLRIQRRTYPAHTLYKDTRAFLRRDSPSLWRDDDHALDTRILTTVRDALARALHDDHPLDREHADTLLFFGCALRHSIKETWRTLETHHRTPLPLLDITRARLDRVHARLHALNAALAELRDLARQLQRLPDIVHHHITEAADVTDEALSYHLESALARIDHHLERVQNQHPDSDVRSRARELRQTGARIARAEIAWRRDRGYCVHDLTDHSLEYFLYRRGQLKKSMDSVLYFDVRTLAPPSRTRHLIGAIGAAFAAAWAFLAHYTAVGAPATGGGVGIPTGMSTFVLFSIAVGAYILKDRIKDVTKERLGSWLDRRNPDRRSIFTARSLNGELHETTTYFDEDDLPSPIRQIRDSDHVVDAALSDNRESILSYRKEMSYTFSTPILASSLDVKDLLRLSVRDFLTYLDDPTRDLHYFDLQEQGFTHAPAPKIYHLNLVLAYDLFPAPEDPDCPPNTTYERLRVILDRNGIVRIESVLPRGTHTWLTSPTRNTHDP